VAVLCEPRFVDLAPAQVYAALLDEDVYLCSERTMYRVLAERGLVKERRRGGHQRASAYGVPRLSATGPNQCWTWDITKLRGPVPRSWFFLYAIIDIYSRKLVGWSIETRESETIARRLITTTCRRYNIDPGQLTIHADRGSPMIANSVADLLTGMGVTKSHSRPRVSNDNPYIEAHFKTLKYRPEYPDRFADIATARAWMRRFEHWYNHVHYHCAIGYHRPADLHTGAHHDINRARQSTLQRAYEQRPNRFRKTPVPPSTPTIAWINQPTIQSA
jgi:putative transposase